MRPECFSATFMLSCAMFLPDSCSLEDDLAFAYYVSTLLMKLFGNLSRAHSIFSSISRILVTLSNLMLCTNLINIFVSSL